MHRREWLATVGTVGTVGVAGCTGSDDTEDPSGEDDPEDREAPETESSLETFEFPEHASREGVSATDLASEHFDRLRDEGSVTVSETSELTTDGHSSVTETTVRISADGIHLTENRDHHSVDRWTEHGTDRGLVKRESGFQTVYQIAQTSVDERSALSERDVSALVEIASFGAATAVTEIDGASAARYDVTELSGQDSRFTGDEVEDASGSLFVTEDGVLIRVEYELTVVYDGREHVESVELTYTDIGSTAVAEPDWTETARRDGLAFDAEVTDDGYLSFELVNGEAISDGTRLSVYVMGGGGETTLPTSIDVGDRLVVAVTETGISAAVNEKPDAESDFSDGFASFWLQNEGLFLYDDEFEFSEE